MTAEEICVEYAKAYEAKQAAQKIISAPSCVNVQKWESASDNWRYDHARPSTCLDEFFGAPKGPDGEFPRADEYLEYMCDPCKAKLGALSVRKHYSFRIGHLKRSLLARGRAAIRKAAAK
jgi:hypothetical protein